MAGGEEETSVPTEEETVAQPKTEGEAQAEAEAEGTTEPADVAPEAEIEQQPGETEAATEE